MLQTPMHIECVGRKLQKTIRHGWQLFLAASNGKHIKPKNRQRHLDAAACGRSSSRKIGEAKNPGPRMRTSPSVPDLEDVR